jgi:hypothetical protein
MEVSGQLHVPAVLTPGKEPLVGPRATLDILYYNIIIINVKQNGWTDMRNKRIKNFCGEVSYITIDAGMTK